MLDRGHVRGNGRLICVHLRPQHVELVLRRCCGGACARELSLLLGHGRLCRLSALHGSSPGSGQIAIAIAVSDSEAKFGLYRQ